MARFIIEGGTPLHGEITPAGNKNEALPLIAASLLTDEPMTLHNVPRIRDVRGMLEIASGLGATVEELDPHTVRIVAAGVRTTDVPTSLAKEIRTSLLFAGSLLGRHKKVRLGRPGGGGIRGRRKDPPFPPPPPPGAQPDKSAGGHGGHTPGPGGADNPPREPSGTADEEPRTRGGLPDAAQDRFVMEPDLGGAIPRIQSQIWPGFPSDLTSIATAVATQSEGMVLIHEWMYEGRLYFADALSREMGARIILADPHRAIVTGPSQLYAAELRSPDIRAGMALLAATLCAKGTSVINSIEQIDRGYEELDARLRALAAKIERAA